MHLLQSKEPLSVLGALQNTEVHPAPESMHSQCCSLPVIPIRMTRLLQKHQDKLLAKWASSSYLSSATTICKIRMRSWRLEEKKKSKEPLNLPQLWRSLLRIRTWICERSRVMRLTLFLASWWRSRALKPTKDLTVRVQSTYPQRSNSPKQLDSKTHSSSSMSLLPSHSSMLQVESAKKDWLSLVEDLFVLIHKDEQQKHYKCLKSSRALRQRSKATKRGKRVQRWATSVPTRMYLVSSMQQAVADSLWSPKLRKIAPRLPICNKNWMLRNARKSSFKTSLAKSCKTAQTNLKNTISKSSSRDIGTSRQRKVGCTCKLK